MLNQCIIQESPGPWMAPVSAVKKKNLIWRFCADHGRLNAIPKQFVYLLPRIHDAIHDFSRPRMFSTPIFGRGIGRFSYTPATMKRENSSLYTVYMNLVL